MAVIWSGVVQVDQAVNRAIDMLEYGKELYSIPHGRVPGQVTGRTLASETLLSGAAAPWQPHVLAGQSL